MGTVACKKADPTVSMNCVCFKYAFVNSASTPTEKLTILDKLPDVIDSDGDLEIVVGSSSGLDVIDIKSSTELMDNWSVYRGTINRAGVYDASVMAIEGNKDILPKSFYVSSNYPNPFNPNIKIHFSVSEFSFIEIDIYNMNGQKVDNINSDYLMPGTYEFEWIPEAQISSGNYFLFIKDSNQHLSQIVTYLK